MSLWRKDQRVDRLGRAVLRVLRVLRVQLAGLLARQHLPQVANLRKSLWRNPLLSLPKGQLLRRMQGHLDPLTRWRRLARNSATRLWRLARPLAILQERLVPHRGRLQVRGAQVEQVVDGQLVRMPRRAPPLILMRQEHRQPRVQRLRLLVPLAARAVVLRAGQAGKEDVLAPGLEQAVVRRCAQACLRA